jgi:NADH-quinone oxidoreductase subunit L
MSESVISHLKESPLSILLPLIILSVASIVSGYLFFKFALTPNTNVDINFFGNTIYQYLQPALGNRTVIEVLATESYTHSPLSFIFHSINTLSFWLALSGLVTAYIFYIKFPKFPKLLSQKKSIFGIAHYILVKKYFIDNLYDIVFVKGVVNLSKFCWHVIDIFIIDNLIVKGTTNLLVLTGKVLKKSQRGYLFDYTFVLLLGIITLILWLIFWIN